MNLAGDAGRRRRRRTDGGSGPHLRCRLDAPGRAEPELRDRVRGALHARLQTVLRILEARREQIAAGLANAEKIKAELDRIEAERVGILAQAGAEGKQLDRGSPRRGGSRAGRRDAARRMPTPSRFSSGRARRPLRDHARMLAELKREVGSSSCRRRRR